jgi:hypothetical protein
MPTHGELDLLRHAEFSTAAGRCRAPGVDSEVDT